MAESKIVPSLFGLTPEMYGEQQRVNALEEGITLAKLDPAARGAAMTYAGGRGLAGAIAGAMGVEDPQLRMISTRNAIAQQIDQTDPESIMKGAQMLAQAGDQQGAMALAQYARQAQGELAQVLQRRAAAQASMAQATRERFQADPEKVRLARAVAATKGEEGSPEYIKAYNESLEKQMTPAEKAEAKPEIQRLQEYAATLPAGSPQLAQVEAIIKAKGERQGTTIKNEIPLGDVLQKVFQSKEKEDSAKAYSQAGEAYTITVPMIKKLETVESTVNNAFTGAGSNAKLALSKGLSALGVKISDRATDTEIADAVSAQVVQQIAKVFPGSQSNKELEQLLKSKFNLQQELPTILRLVGQIKDEMLAQTKTYEQMANLPDSERTNFNAKLAQGKNYQKIKKYREYEKKYLSKTITPEERTEAAKLKQELDL
jgi:hypothetical protein